MSASFIFVVDRGIEPLCQDWESCILTIRWIDQIFLPCVSKYPCVVDRGIEPLCQDWESCILTIRWIDHQASRLRAEAGGFEPPVREPVRQFSKLLVSATHPSFQGLLALKTEGLSHQMRVQRYDYFLVPANFWATFFKKSFKKSEKHVFWGKNQRL